MLVDGWSGRGGSRSGFGRVKGTGIGVGCWLWVVVFLSEWSVLSGLFQECLSCGTFPAHSRVRLATVKAFSCVGCASSEVMTYSSA